VLAQIAPLGDPRDDSCLELDRRVKKLLALFRSKIGEMLDVAFRSHEEMTWHEPRIAKKDERFRALLQHAGPETFEVAKRTGHAKSIRGPPRADNGEAL